MVTRMGLEWEHLVTSFGHKVLNKILVTVNRCITTGARTASLTHCFDVVEPGVDHHSVNMNTFDQKGSPALCI
jgi:hypothetical protein